MIPLALLSRLLMILAIISLAIAPVPVAARGGMPVDAVAVMEGMDCCPPGDPVMPDCQKNCPYLALCMAKCFPVAAANAVRLVHIDVSAGIHRHSPDEAALRRTIRPPAPPPPNSGHRRRVSVGKCCPGTSGAVELPWPALWKTPL